MSSLDPNLNNLDNTPNNNDNSQNSATQESSENQNTLLEESQNNTWGRLIPVNTNHSEISLNRIIEFSDDKNIVTIGRGISSDILLKCPLLSSSHCKLIRNIENDVVFLEDCSTNGTWIDKKKINKSRFLLRDGCEIIFVPASKKRGRKKISYFFHIDSKYGNNRNGTLGFELKYYIIRVLGSGAFSEVKLVQNRSTGVKYAMKCINRHSWARMKSATQRDVSLLDEVDLMAKTDHINIVSVYEYFEEDTRVNVIMDYCGGGDMLEYIQKNGAYNDNKCRKLFNQLINGLEYLHSCKIAHRDLKPDNILLTDKSGNYLKISDFGISRETESNANCKTIIGTPLYQAPEVHLRRSRFSDGYDGQLSDYWSLGIILYVMLVAAPPSTKSSDIVKMAEMKTLLWYDEPITETAKDLIYKLLAVDPKKRIIAKDIRLHPYMKGYDTFNEYNQSKTDTNNNNINTTNQIKQIKQIKPSIDRIDSKEEEEKLLYKKKNENDVEMRDKSHSTNSNNSNNSSSSVSRKRKANFDDDNIKPPAKKYKSDPNGITNDDLIPVSIGVSSTQ